VIKGTKSTLLQGNESLNDDRIARLTSRIAGLEPWSVCGRWVGAGWVTVSRRISITRLSISPLAQQGRGSLPLRGVSVKFILGVLNTGPAAGAVKEQIDDQMGTNQKTTSSAE
jgi:hypothetical protein